MRKYILLCYLLSICTVALFAQACEVKIDLLKGQYTGGCKNGKADGNGNATGIDSYAGNFKNGYPEGQGKYIWKNGDWYEGSWKNGLFEGQGTLDTRVNSAGSIDSSKVVTGFWKKGKYVGLHEKAFIIHSMTSNINDVNIRKLSNSISQITIVVKNITGGASGVFDAHYPKVKLVNVQFIQGQYEQEVPDETSSLVSNTYTFRGIGYPLYAIFYFETPAVDRHVEKLAVEFFEDGDWYVQVNIDN